VVMIERISDTADLRVKVDTLANDIQGPKEKLMSRDVTPIRSLQRIQDFCDMQGVRMEDSFFCWIRGVPRGLVREEWVYEWATSGHRPTEFCEECHHLAA
jgi:hypothetical protein